MRDEVVAQTKNKIIYVRRPRVRDIYGPLRPVEVLVPFLYIHIPCPALNSRLLHCLQMVRSNPTDKKSDFFRQYTSTQVRQFAISSDKNARYPTVL